MSAAQVVHATAWGLAVLALITAVFFFVFEPVLAIGLGVTFAAATAATSFVEARVRLRAAAGAARNDRRVGLAATAVAGAILLAGTLQSVYARAVFERRSIEGGMQRLSDTLVLDEQLVSLLAGAFALGGIYGVALVVRLQREGVLRRASFGLVASVIFPPIGVPLLALLLTGQLADHFSGAGRPATTEPTP